jgi:lysozyme family protein
MSDFNAAIPIILKHEGGWADDPNDKGGATNWGVSLRYAKTLGLMLDIDGDGDVDKDDMRALSREKAIEIYKMRWWDACGYAAINDQLVATKIFDMAVNMGPGAAHCIVQKGCNDCGATLKVDGQLGPVSKASINALNPTAVLEGIRQHQVEFYMSIVRRDPTQQRFLNTWLRRANWPPLPTNQA